MINRSENWLFNQILESTLHCCERADLYGISDRELHQDLEKISGSTYGQKALKEKVKELQNKIDMFNEYID